MLARYGMIDFTARSRRRVRLAALVGGGRCNKGIRTCRLEYGMSLENMKILSPLKTSSSQLTDLEFNNEILFVAIFWTNCSGASNRLSFVPSFLVAKICKPN